MSRALQVVLIPALALTLLVAGYYIFRVDEPSTDTLAIPSPAAADDQARQGDLALLLPTVPQRTAPDDGPDDDDALSRELVIRAPADSPITPPEAPAFVPVPLPRDFPPPVVVDNPPPPQPVENQSGTRYTVKQGDTLWGIAQQHFGDGSQWPRILEANKDKLAGPNELRLGLVLTLP